MVDFSINALTAPFVPPVARYFDKTTKFIISKHPELKLNPDQVNHDLKVVMFNAATALLVSTLAMAYFKTIALVTAVALTILFYLVRRIVQESIFPPKPPSETTTVLQDALTIGRSMLPARRLPAPSPPHQIDKRKSQGDLLPWRRYWMGPFDPFKNDLLSDADCHQNIFNKKSMRL